MDEHEDRTASFEQPAGPVTVPARASRASGLLAGAVVVITLTVAIGASALAAAAPTPSDGSPIVADASASAGASAKPDRPKRDRGEGLGRFGRIEITSIDGDRIGLRTEDGWTRTIAVTTETTIKRGGEAAKVSDLRVGDTVVLRQRRNDDGTFTVTRIAVPAPRVAGVVTAIDGDTITVAARRGATVTLTVDASTTYLTGRDAGTKADLRVGSRIAARGALDDGPGFRAIEIRIAPPLFEGVVSATTGSTITITRRDGTPLTVHVDADTRFQVRGKGRAATLADIAVGARIAATGSLRADGSMDATVVVAGKARGLKPERSAAASPGG